ncbi:sensor histidine kinase [Novosphingobium sp. JCM 18896]|uniref:sensor histidine kinase n=1 Tax=Novosphingobium sp. JCM 18896 TaxID=2989731 RepID=UPI002223A9FA|nr:CHASE3 domain-containing protein [Novosphingobium sp. JCM 18896]MCW1428643.1 CHASE3 domain-containing protein [Novosphingobium sp. JCM 18896]
MNDSATASASVPVRRPPWWGKSMMPVFAGLTAALLALALVIGQTIVAQRDARDLAMTEGDTLLALNALMSAMLNGETGQRGYLLTQRPDYLAPYTSAKTGRDRAMQRLRDISVRAGDARFQADLKRLDGMTDAKFAEMDRSVALARAGYRDQALALIQADFGKMQMDAIRREITRMSLEKAQRRRVAFASAETFEGRLLPLIGVLSLAILALIYAGFRAERSRSLTQAEADQAAALREANARVELLARELNHRVKNLFSVILSIVALSGRKPASAREVVDDIRARIRALSLAHSASQGGYGTSTTELGPLIVKTMEPYADGAGTRVRVGGPRLELPARMITPLGLIVHELATNAVKYGALSEPEGTVEIAWAVEDGAQLALVWTEIGGPEVTGASANAAPSTGFGSQMTSLAASQLGGTIEREWPAGGAIARLKFPLPSDRDEIGKA